MTAAPLARRAEWRRRSQTPLVVAGACAAAAIVATALAYDVAVGIAVLLALCLLPVALLDVPLAVAGWLVVGFLGGFPHMQSVPNRVLIVVGIGWLGLVTARRAAGRPAIPTGRAMLALLALFVLWLGLTLLWAPAPAAGKEPVKEFLYILLAFVVVVSTVTRPQHARWLAAAFVLGAVLSVVWGAGAGGLSGADVGIASDQGRFQGGAGDPNYLAAVLVPAVALAGGLSGRRSALVRVSAAIAVGILAIGLAATQSRGGLLAAGVSFVAAFAIWRGGRRMIAGFVVVFAVAATAWFIASPAAWERVTGAGEYADGSSGRTDIWQVAWRVASQHPVTGVGVGQFPEVSPRYVREPGSLDAVELIVDDHIVVHNVYLQLWAETGLVGLLLFAGLVGAALEGARRAMVRFEALGDREMTALARAVLVAQIGVLTASAFLSNLGDRRIWVLLAFGPALAAMAERRARTSDDYDVGGTSTRR